MNSGDLKFGSSASKTLLRSQEAEIFYVGEKNGLEEKICREKGIIFYGIRAGKWRRYFDWKNFVDLVKIPFGFFEALLILRRLRPDLVFSKGGYVSLPVVLAARVLGIPVWIHESDSTQGLSTRIAARFAEKIFLAFEEAEMSFPRHAYRQAGKRKSICVVGNPIRREILEGRAEEGYKLTGFSSKKPVIFIMGGSIGAQSLNKMIEEILPELTKKAQVVHIAGENNVIASERQRAWQSHSDFYKSFSFLSASDLAHIYRITDLAVSRAGSGSIFELLACHLPMLLIPLPRAASRGDQIENAQIFEHNGWARYCLQEELTPKKLLHAILDFLEDKKALAAMQQKQKSADFSRAAKKIAEAIAEANF